MYKYIINDNNRVENWARCKTLWHLIKLLKLLKKEISFEVREVYAIITSISLIVAITIILPRAILAKVLTVVVISRISGIAVVVILIAIILIVVEETKNAIAKIKLIVIIVAITF